MDEFCKTRPFEILHVAACGTLHAVTHEHLSDLPEALFPEFRNLKELVVRHPEDVTNPVLSIPLQGTGDAPVEDVRNPQERQLNWHVRIGIQRPKHLLPGDQVHTLFRQYLTGRRPNGALAPDLRPTEPIAETEGKNRPLALIPTRLEQFHHIGQTDFDKRGVVRVVMCKGLHAEFIVWMIMDLKAKAFALKSIISSRQIY